ncbi:anti-sigma regulatory factor (Ser/Thr protein kinase) [Chryseobacterium defluvii]|uniref:Anti-sigma regulatory factor (Ser/Thr protein kinase) n=1 Tax=Chryseobacterium defluvii TaxID=160396 RepID=A0A840KBJ4_9FLAO|nr:hypothetical protein [Chryseobacterium defluvii]MBB4805174.1 anti-sigma regulatory factor (Ser/Thr protein kinase) [Chryseobacterium defluvii]
MRWGILVEGNQEPGEDQHEDLDQATFEIEDNIILHAQYADLRFMNDFVSLRRLRNNYKTIQDSPGETAII